MDNAYVLKKSILGYIENQGPERKNIHSKEQKRHCCCQSAENQRVICQKSRCNFTATEVISDFTQIGSHFDLYCNRIVLDVERNIKAEQTLRLFLVVTFELSI